MLLSAVLCVNVGMYLFGVYKLDIISLLRLNIPIFKPEELPRKLKKIEPKKPGSRGLT